MKLCSLVLHFLLALTVTGAVQANLRSTGGLLKEKEEGPRNREELVDNEEVMDEQVALLHSEQCDHVMNYLERISAEMLGQTDDEIVLSTCDPTKMAEIIDFVKKEETGMNVTIGGKETMIKGDPCVVALKTELRKQSLLFEEALLDIVMCKSKVEVELSLLRESSGRRLIAGFIELGMQLGGKAYWVANTAYSMSGSAKATVRCGAAKAGQTKEQPNCAACGDNEHFCNSDDCIYKGTTWQLFGGCEFKPDLRRKTSECGAPYFQEYNRASGGCSHCGDGLVSKNSEREPYCHGHCWWDDWSNECRDNTFDATYPADTYHQNPGPFMFKMDMHPNQLSGWFEAKTWCEDRGLHLASYSDWCSGGKGRSPYGGQKTGDNWVAYSDQENGWLEIGTVAHAQVCEKHNDRYGYPVWGVDRISKSAWENNWVLCRKTAGPAPAPAPPTAPPTLAPGCTHRMTAMGKGDCGTRRRLEMDPEISMNLFDTCSDNKYTLKLYVESKKSHFDVIAVPTGTNSEGCQQALDFDDYLAGKPLVSFVTDLKSGYLEEDWDSIAMPMGTFTLTEIKSAVAVARTVDPDQYDLLTNNCATFVLDVMNYLKIPVTHDMKRYVVKTLAESEEVVAALKKSTNDVPTKSAEDMTKKEINELLWHVVTNYVKANHDNVEG